MKTVLYHPQDFAIVSPSGEDISVIEGGVVISLIAKDHYGVVPRGERWEITLPSLELTPIRLLTPKFTSIFPTPDTMRFL